MEHETRKGGCRCGAVRYQANADPLWTVFCHCESCRRATGAPMVLWLGFAETAVEWHGAAPTGFASSPGVERTFCSTCGTPLTFTGTRWPGETHILAATLDDPGRARPQAHVFWGERLPWLDIGDDLPKFETTSGSGVEKNSER